MMKPYSQPEYPEMERVAQETSVPATNRMLDGGWRLLQVIAARDEYGSYACYVLGKPRVETQNDR